MFLLSCTFSFAKFPSKPNSEGNDPDKRVLARKSLVRFFRFDISGPMDPVIKWFSARSKKTRSVSRYNDVGKGPRRLFNGMARIFKLDM